MVGSLVLVLALLNVVAARTSKAEPEENPSNPCYKNGGCDSHVKCRVVSGKAKCPPCPTGYTGEGKHKCFDKNECGTANGNCDRMTRCVNTEGSYYCTACPQGYSGTGKEGCVDRNECAKNNGGCDVLSKCKNWAGGRSCGKCPKGYTGTGEEGCNDDDECLVNNGGCDEHATCTNTPGSRICSKCKPPYKGDGQTAESCQSPEDIETALRNSAKERSKPFAAKLAAQKAAQMYTEKYFAMEAKHREQEEELARKRIERQQMDSLESRVVVAQHKAQAQRDKRHESESELHKLHASIILKKAQNKVSNIYAKTFEKIAHLKREARIKARERAYMKRYINIKKLRLLRLGALPKPGFLPCKRIPGCRGVPQGIHPIPEYVHPPTAVPTVSDKDTAKKEASPGGTADGAPPGERQEGDGIPKRETTPDDVKSEGGEITEPKAEAKDDSDAKQGGAGGANLPDQSNEANKPKAGDTASKARASVPAAASGSGSGSDAIPNGGGAPGGGSGEPEA